MKHLALAAFIAVSAWVLFFTGIQSTLQFPLSLPSRLPFLVPILLGIAWVALLMWPPVRARAGACLVVAVIASLYLGHITSTRFERYLRWWPNVATWAMLPYADYLVLSETADEIVVRDQSVPGGKKSYPPTVINAHFHDLKFPPCYEPHAKPEMTAYSKEVRPYYTTHFLFWLPLASSCLLAGVLIIDGTLIKLLFFTLQEGVLSVVRHPMERGVKLATGKAPRIDRSVVAAGAYSSKEGIPPGWRSDLMRKRIEKLTRRLEAETAFLNRLKEYWRSHAKRR